MYLLRFWDLIGATSGNNRCKLIKTVNATRWKRSSGNLGRQMRLHIRFCLKGSLRLTWGPSARGRGGDESERELGARVGGENKAVCSSEGREKLGHTLGIKVGAQYIGSTSQFTSPRVDSRNHERARSNAGVCLGWIPSWLMLCVKKGPVFISLFVKKHV